MTEIALARQRAIMIGLYLDLRGQTAKHYFPAISDPLARELTAVMAAVLLAQIKQRVATVAVVARHTGIPRVTALRRLEMLVRLGPQLPENHEDGLLVLKYVREIYDRLYAPAVSSPVVLTLVEKTQDLNHMIG